MAELHWRGKYVEPHVGTQRLLTCATYPATVESAPCSTEGQIWQNRLIQGERASVLNALLPDFAGRVDLIYIDPPFMTERSFSSYNDKWHNDLDNYVQWLFTTLRLLHRLLAEDGSIYVHLDWRVTHYARVILDEIFGTSRGARGPGFKNEIIWHYQSGGRATRHYARKHDTLL